MPSYPFFLGRQTPLVESRAVIIPAPFEGAVTGSTGSRKGPEAILEASAYLEWWDEETRTQPADLGIHTLKPIDADGEPEAVHARIQSAVSDALSSSRLPVVLGGDHSVTLGAVRAARDRYPNLSILHLDAHDDFRDDWHGDSLNHACVMRRVYELGVKGAHVGIRSQDSSTDLTARRLGAKISLARRPLPRDAVLSALTRDVYLSIDVDAFDPSLMPSTGTPEPGGMTWDAVLDLIQAVAAHRRIVGFDVTELAPIRGQRAPDVLAAKLVYKTLAYAWAHQLPRG